MGNDGAGFVKELLADHESIMIILSENINHLAIDIHDAGTSDFINARWKHMKR